MNDKFPNGFGFNNSGFGCLLTLLLVVWLLGAVGLGWLVNSLLILLALLLFMPAIAWFVFRWWVGRNLVEASCPTCNYEFTGFNGTECRCPNCEELLKVESGSFQRLNPPGTIDVEAIEVPGQQLED